MKKWKCLVVLLAWGAILLPWRGPAPGAAQADGDYRLVAYYTAWGSYGPGYAVRDVPAAKLTHLIYAFANISAAGECVPGDPYADLGVDLAEQAATRPPGGNFAALAELRREHPHLQTLISIGGYTWSGGFSDAALTPDARRRFAESCVRFMARYGFDGIDVDWEFPVEAGHERTGRPEDRANYTRLLAELRTQLDVQGRADGREYLLTVAAPHIPRFMAHMDLPAIAPLVDWFNLMSYSFPGEPGKTTHQAPLFAAGEGEPYAQHNMAVAVDAYLALGIPAEKIVAGVPFYALAWAGVGAANGGLFQSYEGLAAGTRGPGVFGYGDVTGDAFAHFDSYWDEGAQAAWLVDPATGVMVTFESERALRAKVDFVRARGLGGMMVWELSFDDDAHTLLGVLAAGLLADGQR